MRRTLTSALIGGAAASGGGTIKLNWSDCGDSSTHGHITSLSPTSVTLGTKTSISGKGKLDEAIPGATYKVVAKEGFIPIFSHSGDACKPDTIKLPAGAGQIDMKGFKCPLSPGAAELDLDLSLSSSIPAKLARITIDLTAKTSSGDKALCVQIKTAPENLIADGENLIADPALVTPADEKALASEDEVSSRTGKGAPVAACGGTQHVWVCTSAEGTDDEDDTDEDALGVRAGKGGKPAPSTKCDIDGGGSIQPDPCACKKFCSEYPGNVAWSHSRTWCTCKHGDMVASAQPKAGDKQSISGRCDPNRTEAAAAATAPIVV